MENFDLSKRVKELRAKRGFSQEQLADTSGLSLRTIQRIENGETVPRGDTLKRLATALQVSSDELINWQLPDDNNVLIMLHLSQFGALVFPLLGIIIPLAVWIFKKNTVKNVDEHGKAILNFQISWFIVLFILPISLFMIQICHLNLGFPFERLLISSLFVLIGLYVYNILTIIINLIRIDKGKTIRYVPSLILIR